MIKKDNKTIKTYREKIDAIDSQILKIINERLSFVKKIGDIKRENNRVFYVPSREQMVFRHLIQENKGLLKTQSIKAIFREIMSSALSLEHPLCIEYFGQEGSNTHCAALSRFGNSVEYVSAPTIKTIFEDLSHKKFDYGVVPAENSTEGSISSTMDMFVDYDLTICSEISLQIDNHFLVKDVEADINEIYSHEQVLHQCRNWLHKNYPNASLIKMPNTVLAAKEASQQTNAAAIAGDLVLQLYPLQKKFSHIQDYPINITRFFVIGHQKSDPTQYDKTSVLFSIKDEPGLLASSLNVLSQNHLNLTRIESRPFKKDIWKYYFYIDIEGHRDDPSIKQAFAELQKKSIFFKVLGSYPRDDSPCSKK